MRTPRRTAVLLATAGVLTLVARTAATAAPARTAPKRKPVVALSGARFGFVGQRLTFKDHVALPAKDRLKSWTLSYGDHAAAHGNAKNVPTVAHHVYRTTGRAKLVLTVTDVHRKRWSATETVTIGPAPVVAAPLPVPTPAAPYVVPTGTVQGHVNGTGSGGIRNLVGIPVTVDGVAATAHTTTDIWGNWAVTLPPQTQGYAVTVNRDLRLDAYAPGATNLAYPVYSTTVFTEIGNNAYAALPALTTPVTGTVSGIVDPDNDVVALLEYPDDSTLVAYGTVSGSSYTINLFPASYWSLAAFDKDQTGWDSAGMQATWNPPAAAPTLVEQADGADYLDPVSPSP
jgi:hypothetical protein